MKLNRLIELLHEMPSPIVDMGKRNDEEGPLGRKPAESLIKDTITIDGKPVQVAIMEYGHDNAGKAIYFLLNKKTIAYFSGSIQHNRLITHSTETRTKVVEGRSLLAELYIKYLLPKYGSIVSDSHLSPDGFRFWKRNFDLFIQHGYEINLLWEDENRSLLKYIENIKNSAQLEDFYRDGLDDYRFEITSKVR